MKIIALEDNRDLQLFYKKILTMWGHEVLPCLNLAEAREALGQSPRAELTLADLTLPDASPEQLQAAFLGPEFRGIPVVLTSGRDDLETWGRAMGAAQTFLKPVDIMKLKAFISKCQSAAKPAPEASL